MRWRRRQLTHFLTTYNGRNFLKFPFSSPHLELVGQRRHHRIVTQPVAIVQVLVAECNLRHASVDQRHHMLDQMRPWKHAANLFIIPIARSGAPNRSPPATEVIAPPSNAATTSRPSTGVDAKLIVR
jgi:hypothetical protein